MTAPTTYRPGHCSECGWSAREGVMHIAPGVEPRLWWHEDPRAMWSGREHPVSALFVPDDQAGVDTPT